MNRKQRRGMESSRRKVTASVHKKVKLAIAQRQCGPCQACCTVMKITELDKPAGQACSNLCESGCGIYKSRPGSCREFQCVWKMGLGRKEERPDLSGLLFDVTRGNGVVQALVVREAKPGAFEESAPVLERLVDDGHLLYLIKDDYRAIMGPPEKVALARQQATVAAASAGV